MLRLKATAGEVSAMSILRMPALCDIIERQELKQQPGTECVLQREARCSGDRRPEFTRPV